MQKYAVLYAKYANVYILHILHLYALTTFLMVSPSRDKNPSMVASGLCSGTYACQNSFRWKLTFLPLFRRCSLQRGSWRTRRSTRTRNIVSGGGDGPTLHRAALHTRASACCWWKALDVRGELDVGPVHTWLGCLAARSWCRAAHAWCRAVHVPALRKGKRSLHDTSTHVAPPSQRRCGQCRT